ncbi:hypothetical protein MVEN_01169500 [Mycena venus]|uniref:Uncharacterized protein n=1 Tax=Mycena venus TaxID=2733690 RepID=A0A8H6Y3L9_9AGAR|nr:hypothetical protein MVEN_01169500 [Mycena venus]
MPYLVDPSVFDNYWENVQNEFCTAIMDVLLYGVFIVLFFVSIQLLCRRKTPGRMTFLMLSMAMAVMATTQFCLHIATTTLALRLLRGAITNGQLTVPSNPIGDEHLYWTLVLVQDCVLVTNTVITDSLLVYRCYLVWGRPHKIFVIVPILLMLGTLATGYVTSYDEDYSNGPYHFDPRIVFTLNLFNNFILMMLTAGRIWWVTRTQRAVFGSEFTPRYNAAIAIILESGAIYCLGLVFQVVALSVQDSFPTAVYLSHGTAGQLVNIAPTLIAVRVGLGHAVPTAATDATTTVPQSRVNNSRPLRFAPEAFSPSDVECGVSGEDIRLETPQKSV